MTLCSDLIDSTLDFLLGSQDDEVNVLAGTVNASVTSLSFDYSLEGIVPGATIGVGLEVLRVVEVNNTSNTATVIRGQRGSTAAAHTAGDVVQVAPRFSRWSVFRALNDDLASLSGAGLYQMLTVPLTYVSSIKGYDLTAVTDVEQVYSVRYKVPNSEKEWPRLEQKDYRFDAKANTTDFASGFSLTILNGGYPGQPMQVAYKAPFSPMTAEANNVLTVTGLPATAHDLPPLGAAIRLQSGHESGRVDYSSQPDTRRADEVGVGGSLQAASGWRALRKDRIDEELRRQMKRYPVLR